MLRIKTDYNKLNRFDVEADQSVIDSGVTGTHVVKSGDKLQFPASGTTGLLTVWTESYRDGSTGKWTPDVDATGNLTVVFGKMRALTTEFKNSPSVGDLLEVAADGTLQPQNTGEAVARCTKASHSVEHVDNSYTVIEYITL